MPTQPARLFDPARRRIADTLCSQPAGAWSVDAVAAAHGIHRTVAFAHLEWLVAAGIATKASERRGRGRPVNVYTYTGARVDISYPPRRHRLLAEVMVESVRMGAGPRDVARRRGHEEELGDEYAFENRTVHARTCMFGSVCGGADDVVCAVHAGWIEGALEAAGRESEVAPLGPDGAGGCRFRLN